MKNKISKKTKFLKPTKNWEIGFINNFSIPTTPSAVERFIRAMQPWPGAWTNVVLNSKDTPKRLKLLKGHLYADVLVLDEVQLEGKNPVSWEQFKLGYPSYTFPKK